MKFSLPLLLIVTSAVFAGSASAKPLSADTEVNLPGNTSCQVRKTSISCTGPTFGAAECGGTKSWKLKKKGRVSSSSHCGISSKVKTYGEGKTFSRAGVSCKALADGVRCKNKSGRGFTITSATQTKF